jgi:hypothetical protein
MRYSLAAAVLASVVLSVAAEDHLILVGAGGNVRLRSYRSRRPLIGSVTAGFQPFQHLRRCGRYHLLPVPGQEPRSFMRFSPVDPS